ncbi:cysteine-rich with EGF-like domain protein 2 isoform X2 [Anabrus simplex]
MRFCGTLPVIVLLATTSYAEQVSSASDQEKQASGDKLKTIILPPCQACKTLVQSFKKGIERTARGNFAGGDTAWEEERLGSYTRSEIRLVEIQEKLCLDVDRGEAQCHTLAEEAEQLLEDWWFHMQDSNPELQEWLCISSLKYCCPDEHYGPECKPCPGHPGKICSGNGKCKGAGTRKGNGVCACDPGYDGQLCDKCALYYYESYHDDNKILCAPCHTSCQGACSQAGPKGCAACKSGWVMDTEKGCVDIDECFASTGACTKNQFCVNNDGSFSCLECDKACDGCHGDGPDMCTKCAEGFTLQDTLCIDDREWSRDSRINLTRYLTYAGLCVATCIVFQKNMLLASLIGLSVAVYISVSEYMLGSYSRDTGGMVDLPTVN